MLGHGTRWPRKTNVWPKLTKNDGFGAYLAVFGQQLPFFGREQKIWYPHLFCVQNIDQQFPHGLLGPYISSFDPKIMIFEANSPFFV